MRDWVSSPWGFESLTFRQMRVYSSGKEVGLQHLYREFNSHHSLHITLQGREMVSLKAHNLGYAGSNPVPAPIFNGAVAKLVKALGS